MSEKKISCIKCNSDKVLKHGKTSSGLPRYKCKNCKKTWTVGKVNQDRPNMDKIVSMYFDGHSIRDLVPIYKSSPHRINTKIREFLGSCPDWQTYLDSLIPDHKSNLILLTGINFSCNCEHDDCNNNYLAIAVDAVSSIILSFQISIDNKPDVWEKLLANISDREIKTENFIFNGSKDISNAIRNYYPDAKTHISILKKIRRKEIINNLDNKAQTKLLIKQTIEHYNKYDNKSLESYLASYNTSFDELLNSKEKEFLIELKKSINNLKNNIDLLIEDFKERFERFHMLKCEPYPIVNGWVAYHMLKKIDNEFNRLSFYKSIPDDSNFEKFTNNVKPSEVKLDKPEFFSYQMGKNLLSIPSSIFIDSENCNTFKKLLVTNSV